jgi:anti-sigma factor RsiW
MGKTCPDRHILSVYFDNELDSPWKEKFEAHLASCPDCRAELAAYEKIRGLIVSDRDRISGLEKAKTRVWDKLEPAIAPALRPVKKGFWNGYLNIPLPVAAAASLVLVAAFALLLVLRPVRNDVPGDDWITVAEQVPDMPSLIQNDFSPDMVVVNLPVGKTFTSLGQPQIIRKADYRP